MKFVKRIGAALLTLAMLVSLFAVGGVSVSALSGAGLSSNAGYNVAFGCDISYWNVGGDYVMDYSLVDFAKMKADGCEFVILRIGYEASATRSDVVDMAFVQFYNRARAAGLDLGVYFYALSTTYAGAVQDAQWVMNVIEQYNMYFEYPIYYDVEDAGQVQLGSSAMESLCSGWCDTLAAAGYFPGIYSGEFQCFNKLSSTFKEKYDGWVASVLTDGHGSQYNPNTMSKSSVASMWQYAWYDYNYNGIGLDMLDVNVSYKDYPTIMNTYGYNNVAARQTVTFETNGGSAIDPMKVVAGKGFTAPTNPTKQGFTFAGWYANPELTDVYDFNAAVPEYDFTLYAKWDEAYWEANTDLMPKSGKLQSRYFQETGEHIWDYYNSETGACSMYSGVSLDHAWPSAYMLYENSVDINNDSYIYFKKDGNAQFNVELTYMDHTGKLHSIKLSEILQLETTDFPAGYMEVNVNVRQYIIDQGHMPASGNLKYTQMDYYVIGAKDQWVTLYDLKFTPEVAIADPYSTFMSSNITQLSGEGSYEYNSGTLTMSSTSADGYSLKMDLNKTINPSEMANLLMDINSTVDFNIAVSLTNGHGDGVMYFNTEFYDVFELNAAPTNLPAGDWSPLMSLNGYYIYNGGALTESTIKSVTITMAGQGTLTLDALQASRKEEITYVYDGQYASGSLKAGQEENKGVLGDADENGKISVLDARRVLLAAIGGVTLTDSQKAVSDYNGDGRITALDARAILLAAIAQ